MLAEVGRFWDAQFLSLQTRALDITLKLVARSG
jgi:hypothetical protein